MNFISEKTKVFSYEWFATDEEIEEQMQRHWRG